MSYKEICGMTSWRHPIAAGIAAADLLLARLAKEFPAAVELILLPRMLPPFLLGKVSARKPATKEKAQILGLRGRAHRAALASSSKREPGTPPAHTTELS